MNEGSEEGKREGVTAVSGWRKEREQADGGVRNGRTQQRLTRALWNNNSLRGVYSC